MAYQGYSLPKNDRRIKPLIDSIGSGSFTKRNDFTLISHLCNYLLSTSVIIELRLTE